MSIRRDLLSKEAIKVVDDYGIPLEPNPDRNQYLVLATEADILNHIAEMVDIERVYARNGGIANMTCGRCYYCGVDLEPGFHVDHFIAKSKGGPNGRTNLVPSCPACNMSKSNLDLDQFRSRVFGDEGGLFWFETLDGIYLIKGEAQ